MTEDDVFAEAVVSCLSVVPGTCPICFAHNTPNTWRLSKVNTLLRICPHCLRAITSSRLFRYWGMLP
jgi:hypothetical protein